MDRCEEIVPGRLHTDAPRSLAGFAWVATRGHGVNYPPRCSWSGCLVARNIVENACRGGRVSGRPQGSGRLRPGEGGLERAQRGPDILGPRNPEAWARASALQPVRPGRALPPAAAARTGTPSLGSRAPEEAAGA